MNYRNSLWVCVLALALALPSGICAKNCLTTTFTGATSTSQGCAALFDMVVANPVLIQSIDCNFTAAAGVPVGLDFWVTPNTWVGNETNQSLWTLLGSDNGAVVSAGGGQPTRITFATPILVQAGTYGVSLVSKGVTSHRYLSGTATSYSDSFLTLNLGAIQATPFTSGLLNPRIWNGTICYLPGSGLFPDFDATPRSGNAPLNVQFTDHSYSSDPGGVLGWQWDVDGDGVVDYTTQNPSHTYTAGGKYTVSLTVTDNVFGTRSLTKTDYIAVDPIVADFTAAPTFGALPLLVQFTDTTTGNPTAWLWDFDNDGNVDSTAQHPTWTYTEPGVYSVKLFTSNGFNSESLEKVDLIAVFGSSAPYGGHRPPTPDAPGPWAVGHSTRVFVDATRGDRSLPVDIWYPVEPANATGPATGYPLYAFWDELLGAFPLETTPSWLDCREDATPADAGGFPLVVHSHGNLGDARNHSLLCETLASHGFVVAAADHRGDTSGARWDPIAQIRIDRPRDIIFVIDEMLSLNGDPADALVGMIDGTRIALTGHSFGGYGSLAVAGGLPEVPRDPRIAAVVAIATGSGYGADLAGIRIPVLVLGGGADTDRTKWAEEMVYAEMSRAPSLMYVEVEGAGHVGFGSNGGKWEQVSRMTTPIAVFLAVGGGVGSFGYREGYGPGLTRYREVNRIENTYVVSFLKTHVAGERDYSRYLTPGYANREPLVSFLRGSNRPAVAEVSSDALQRPLLLDFESLPPGHIDSRDPAFTSIGLVSVEASVVSYGDARPYTVDVAGQGLATVGASLHVVGPGDRIDYGAIQSYIIRWQTPTRRFGFRPTNQGYFSALPPDRTYLYDHDDITMSFWRGSRLVAIGRFDYAAQPGTTRYFECGEAFDRVTISHSQFSWAMGIDDLTVER